ncbi:MAG: DUF481 domain-containing protein [Kiritimatiellia bacterium]|jgi:putative salt-induced outer membrane protein YdiY|nr:DUF481 domain-containing protein [Kiritimatiellia bacterium]
MHLDISLGRWWRGVGVGVLAWGITGLTWAQAVPTQPASETNAPALTPELEMPVVPPPQDMPAEEAEEPAAPAQSVKPPPAYHGVEMKKAFQGARSRYGVSGRVHKPTNKNKVKKPKDAWKLKLDLGLQSASGNSDTLNFKGAVTASKETDLNYYYLKAAGRYGESDNEKDTENATLEGQIQRRFSERMYVAMAGHAFYDQIADLSYRVRSSISLGRHLIWTDRTVVNVEIGPGYVAERIGGETEGFVAGRVAQYLEIMLTPSLQVWESIEYLNSLEDSRVYFVNAEVGLESVLVANLSMRFTVENRYDSQPADDKENNDVLTTTSLVWSF